MDGSDKLFLILLIAALAAAVVLAVGRAQIEQANRTVDIILDADDARVVAAAAGEPLPEFLGKLREAGGSALAVRELTVGELIESGRVLAMSAPGRTSLVTPAADLSRALGVAIAARLPYIQMELAGPPMVLRVDADADVLAQVPVLLRPEDIQAARSAGLRIAARLRNFAGASPYAIQAAAAEAHAAGARLVVFDEEEVLGYDQLLRETAAAFRQHDLLYGFVEMAGQKGDDELARRLASRLVRVHSISESDMLTMVPAVAVPRYARAVRERNIRACYLRLMTRPQPDAAAANVRYVDSVARALVAQGFRLGPATPFTAPAGWPPQWLRMIAVLGLPAALVLLLRRLIPMAAGWAWALFLATALAGLGLGLLRSALVVPVAGLAAACIFPALGVLWALQGSRGTGLRPGTGDLVGSALWRLVAASVVSVAGGLLITALYSRVGDLAGVRVFAGVKFSYVLPLAVILTVIVADLPGRPEPFVRWWARARLRAAQFLTQPITALQAIVILFALAALGFALTRSGNQPVLAPSGAEIGLRGLLESLLVVRPRTKEFLLGHPALMLAVALALRGRTAWLPLAALIAGLGQVSLINTFCHFHTPLYVSFLRTGHGLWIGAVIGTAVILVWRVLCDPGPRPSSR